MKAVLFDLDGTLHDRAATLRGWLAGHVARYGLPDGYAERFTVLDDLGYRPKREVMPLLVHEFALTRDPQVLLDDFSAHSLAAPVPMPHAHDVLRELRWRGVQVGVVTNGWVEAQTACLERSALAPLVDDVVISQGVGLSKPDPAIYTLALSRLGVSAADAWFVGDSPRNDVWGPQQVGLRAAYLPTGHALKGEVPDAVLGDLRDVLSLPGR
ncbi:HAD family hydrolase [Deinococcus planocerae]|uniref:HAD family hydrolase n=1 Tax=Deinococcus planocerae TaxID=1737569 RepID=UPI000C7F3BC8|nr:HAD family hydrolase [Deinococcus planocerae]